MKESRPESICCCETSPHMPCRACTLRRFLSLKITCETGLRPFQFFSFRVAFSPRRPLHHELPRALVTVDAAPRTSRGPPPQASTPAPRGPDSGSRRAAPPLPAELRCLRREELLWSLCWLSVAGRLGSALPARCRCAVANHPPGLHRLPLHVFQHAGALHPRPESYCRQECGAGARRGRAIRRLATWSVLGG